MCVSMWAFVYLTKGLLSPFHQTSRRTTRRPQTLSQSTVASSSSTLAPPFTQQPLIHHSHQPTGPQPPYRGQPYGYPYPAAPGYPLPLPSPSQPPPALSDVPPDKDAYETAQDILKAINFGGLLQLSNSNDNNEDQELNGNNAAGSTASGNRDTTSGPPICIPNEQVDGDNTASEAIAMTTSPTVSRAELQARLVLLATQLGAIAKDEPPGTVVANGEPDGPNAPESTAEAAEEGDSEEDMEEVI